MQNYENSELMNPAYNMPEMNRGEANPMMKYQAVFPEIFYKLQPYIMMVCDQMEYNSVMPDIETVQQMTDNIYNDVCEMYPDLAEYARENENAVSVDQFGFGRRFRRRGLFRDIIDILLLSELFNRRRRRFY